MDMGLKCVHHLMNFLRDLSSKREGTDNCGLNHKDIRIWALNRCHMLYKRLRRPPSLKNSTMVLSGWLNISSSVSPGRRLIKCKNVELCVIDMEPSTEVSVVTINYLVLPWITNQPFCWYDGTFRILTSPAIGFYLEFCEIVKPNSK